MPANATSSKGRSGGKSPEPPPPVIEGDTPSEKHVDSTRPSGDKSEWKRPPETTRAFPQLLDQILRRRETFFEEIYEERQIGRWIRWFLLAICLLTTFYGATMGLIGFGDGLGRGLLQTTVTALKVPALYLVSLAICYPVLYVVLVLMGARSGFLQTLALILLALTLNSVLLASSAPIVLFFSVTGATYHFIKLLHVVIFAFAGLWSMMSLWQGLQVMCEKSDLYPKKAIGILQVWILVFGFVGTQMAWSLRPFVGDPNLPYQVFRIQAGNFYAAVWSSALSFARGTDVDSSDSSDSSDSTR